MLSMSVERDRWERVAGDNVLIKEDILAFVQVRADILALYDFWSIYRDCCAVEDAQVFNKKIDEFWDVLMKVPMRQDLYNHRYDGLKGGVEYINKDYFGDGANKNHKLNVSRDLADVMCAMRSMQDEVSEKWTMTEDVKVEYDAVKEKAFGSVCVWDLLLIQLICCI